MEFKQTIINFYKKTLLLGSFLHSYEYQHYKHHVKKLNK